MMMKQKHDIKIMWKNLFIFSSHPKVEI